MSSQPQNPALDGQAFLDLLEASLRRQPNLDAADREFLLGHFRDALSNPDAAGQGVDRETWMNSIAQLGLSDDEHRALASKFEQLFQPLEDETRALGDEFVRRLARDGEAKAQQWLHEQIGRIKGSRGPEAAAQIVAGLPPQVGKAAQARKPGPWG